MGFGNGKTRQKARKQYELLSGNRTPISIGELSDNLREQDIGLTQAQVYKIRKAAVKNENTLIDFREFERLMASPLGRSTKTRRAMRTLADGVIANNQKLEVHSYLDAYTCCPPPIFILSSSIVQIAVFFYYYFNEPHPDGLMATCAGCYSKDGSGPLLFTPRLRDQAWRFWTYQFLHFGLPHLLGNITMQLILGVPLEIVHKVWRIGPLYTIAVCAGSLLCYSFDPTTSLVGASAGVYALITAHLANVFMNWSEMPYRWVRLFIIGVYLCFDIGGVIYIKLIMNICDTVSHTAHLAGGFTGLCFGIFILYNVVEHTWEKVVRWICVVAYVIFFVGLIIMAIIQSPGSKPIWDMTKCNDQ